MRRIEAALRAVVTDLRELDREFALLGGFAVSARAEPRTTRDVDLAVRVDDDADAELLAFELARRGYAIRSTVEQIHTGRLATIRTVAPSGAIVDLLFASSGIEPELVRAATTIAILRDLELPVATIGHLVATKVLARDDQRRPQDRIDLQALFRVASQADLAEARQALDLMSDRGYARGRPLRAELDNALAELGSRS